MSEQARLSRRRFLIGSSAAAGLAVMAACTDDDDDGLGTGGGTRSTGGGRPTAGGDTDVAAFAAGLEVLAVDTYRSVLEAASAGSLGDVPPAGAELVKTALSHHEAHRDSWNAVLSRAGRPPVTRPDERLARTVNADLSGVRDFEGAASLALRLEEILAATYLDAIPGLRSPEAVQQVASIQAVDAKHVAVLLFLLGEYPVPDTFARTEKAATPA